VREVVTAAHGVVGRPFNVEMGPRRPTDMPDVGPTLVERLDFPAVHIEANHPKSGFVEDQHQWKAHVALTNHADDGGLSLHTIDKRAHAPLDTYSVAGRSRRTVPVTIARGARLRATVEAN